MYEPWEVLGTNCAGVTLEGRLEVLAGAGHWETWGQAKEMLSA